MKAKNMIWKSADGRTSALSEMETEHLHNLVMYLFRRMEEAAKLAQFAEELGKVLPEASTQGAPLSQWVKAGIKELHNREVVEYQSSMDKVLRSPHYKGGV